MPTPPTATPDEARAADARTLARCAGTAARALGAAGFAWSAGGGSTVPAPPASLAGPFEEACRRVAARGGTLALRLDAGAFLGAAMVEGGEVLGVLGVVDPSPRAWSAGEVATLAELAATAAEAIGARAGRRRAEAALAATFENSAVGQAHADPATGRFLRVNARMAEIAGYPAAELVGMSIAELNHPEDRAADAAAFGAMARGEAADYVVEKRYVRKDGTVAWVSAAARLVLDDHGRPSHTAAAVTDVTAHRAALEALRDRDERLRRFADSDVIGIVEADLHGGLARVNDEFLRLTGYTREDFDAGRVRWDDLTPAEHLPRDLAAIAEARARGACSPYKKDYVRKDGTRVPIQLGFALVGPRRDEALAYVLDLTELKESERRAVHARRAAEAASRAKDQFLAMLSHELRTPLTPALLATTAALMDPALSADHREAFEAVRRGVELEVRLIDDLLDIAKVASGKMSHQPATVDPRDLVRRAAELCAPEAEAHGVDLLLDLGPPGHAVRADPARLQQVVWNLVKNAIKFTPPGGTVRVRARAEGDGLAVEVADTGIGLDADALARIFEPFEQVEGAIARRYGGLGLGLAIGRAIAEAHGATLTGTSPGPGLGSSFTLRLPLATAVGRPAPPDAPATPSAAARRKILLVEDDAATGRVMAKLLARAGFDVRAAEGVGAALAAPGGPFDLLVSDIGLPDGTGLDLLRRLRARGPIPALALSGFGTDDDHRRAADAGFDAQLTKPVDFAKLVDVIHRVLGDSEAPP